MSDTGRVQPTRSPHGRYVRYVVAFQVALVAAAVLVGLVAYLTGTASALLVAGLAGSAVAGLVLSDLAEVTLLRRNQDRRQPDS